MTAWRQNSRSRIRRMARRRLQGKLHPWTSTKVSDNVIPVAEYHTLREDLGPAPEPKRLKMADDAFDDSCCAFPVSDKLPHEFCAHPVAPTEGVLTKRYCKYHQQFVLNPGFEPRPSRNFVFKY
jgi:hypothetical protein